MAHLEGAGAGSAVVQSAAGVTQGDGLGTILFCIALHRVLVAASRAHPSVDVSAIVDDIRLTGPPDETLACYATVKSEMAKLGLRVKEQSAMAWSPDGITLSVAARCEALGILHGASGVDLDLSSIGEKYLGAPVGSPEFCTRWLEGKVPGMIAKLARIRLMPPGAGQQALIRHCAAAWLGHLTRAISPSAISPLLVFDEALVNLQAQSLGCLAVPSTFTRCLLQLPLAWAGNGCESLESLALRANLASWLHCSGPLAELYPLVGSWVASSSLGQGLEDQARLLQDKLLVAQEGWQSLEGTTHQPHPGLFRRAALDLQGSAQILESFLSDRLAHHKHASKRLAAITRADLWLCAVSLATPAQLAVLRAGTSFGSRSWVEPYPCAQASLPKDAYLVAMQQSLGLPLANLPRAPTGSGLGSLCAVDSCHHPVIDYSSPDPLDHVHTHAASHGELLGSHVHKPITRLLVRMFSIHGHTAVLGDVGSGPFPHSADVTVLHWFGVGDHLRLDVKSVAEFGATNRSVPELLAARETKTRREHSPCSVTPFVVGVAGSLGLSALGVVARLVGSSGARRLDGCEPLWTVPSVSKFWHRVIRVQALSGWYSVLQAVVGSPGPSASPSEAPLATSAEEMRLLGLLSASSDGCPACGEGREACVCQCRVCGCVPAQALGSSFVDFGWPPCTSCSACSMCCSCFS